MTVSELTADHAVLTCWEQSRPVIEIGGGTLHGGGTVLFTADGRIHHIPPGDPFEKRATSLVKEAMAALAKQVKKLGSG